MIWLAKQHFKFFDKDGEFDEGYEYTVVNAENEEKAKLYANISLKEIVNNCLFKGYVTKIERANEIIISQTEIKRRN